MCFTEGTGNGRPRHGISSADSQAELKIYMNYKNTAGQLNYAGYENKWTSRPINDIHQWMCQSFFIYQRIHQYIY